MKEKISIILPVYNVEKWLSKCLDSILNQSYENYEVICVNDGSLDNSLKILRKYEKKDKRIIVIDKENEGVSTARNIAINKSTGKYITFVDPDDYLEKDALETMIKLIKKEKVDIVRTKYNKIFEHHISHENEIKYNNKVILNNKNKKNIIESVLLQEFGCYLWLLLIKKDLIIKNNIYFEKELYVHQDLDFYIKLFKHAKNIYFSNKITYNYLFNNNGSKNLKYVERNIESNLNLFKKLNKLLGKNYIPFISVLCFNLILTYFRPLYNEDKKKFKRLYKNLMNNKDFINLIKNISKTKAFKYLIRRDKIYYIFLRYSPNINIICLLIKLKNIINVF